MSILLLDDLDIFPHNIKLWMHLKKSVERKNKVKFVYKCSNTRKFVKTIFRLECRLLFKELKT